MEIALIYKFKYYKIHLYVLFIIYIVDNVYCLEYVFFIETFMFLFHGQNKVLALPLSQSPLRTSVEISVREEAVVLIGLRRLRPF